MLPARIMPKAGFSGSLPRRVLSWFRFGTERREQRQQRALDRGLARRSGDLRAGEISHIENVDNPLTEGRDMRLGDVEVELR